MEYFLRVLFLTSKIRKFKEFEVIGINWSIVEGLYMLITANWHENLQILLYFVEVTTLKIIIAPFGLS